MGRFFYDSFEQYLCSKGVKKVDFILKNNETLNRNILESNVNRQLENISEVHCLSTGFNGYLKKRINNQTCKLYEEEKIQLRKFKKNHDRIMEQGPDNNVEQIVFNRGSEIIERAEQVISTIEGNGYLDLIKRSMDNIEICLTDVGFDNLGRDKDTITIVNFDDIAYNMVEMDCYYFLAKLKRKGFNIDFDKAIDTFCELEHLDRNSDIYIKSLLSFPHEFLKIFGKYRKNKRGWNEEEYVRRLNNALREDHKSLI